MKACVGRGGHENEAQLTEKVEPGIPEYRAEDVVLDVVEAESEPSDRVTFEAKDVVDVSNTGNIIGPIRRNAIENGANRIGVIGVDEERFDLCSRKVRQVRGGDRAQVVFEAFFFRL